MGSFFFSKKLGACHFAQMPKKLNSQYFVPDNIEPEMKIIFTLVAGLFVLTVSAQNQKSIEQSLLNQFKKIGYWFEYKSDTSGLEKYDSLEKVNDDFQKLLVQYAVKYPSTIGYGFKELDNEGISISTSSDGLFRIYSWDTYTGGTMHIFKGVYQFKANGKVYAKPIECSTDEGDPGYWYSKIYSVNANGKTYYLAVLHAIYSTGDLYQGVKAFCMEKNNLNTNAKLIKTTSGLQNTLGFEFNLFSLGDRPLELVSYNASTKTLTIPVVYENGKVTDKIISYQFTGKYFERKK